MVSFIKKIFLFLFIYSFVFTVVLLSILFFFKKIELPPPNLTDSFSYNEKLHFLRQSKVKPEVIVLGSSMALNNINSYTLIKRTKCNSFLNLSSWGMNLKDDFELLMLIKNKYPLKKIILVSNYVDFCSKDKKIKTNLIQGYLKNGNALLTHILSFNFSYYYLNKQYVSYVRHHENHYESLAFDDFGTVNFERKKFNINKKRFNSYFSMKIIGNQYIYLDKIIEYCRENNIKFYFMLTPIREGLYKKLTSYQKKIINKHVLKINQLMKKGTFNFYNSYENTWSDSLFVDGIHFNKDGAIKFTNKSFDFFDFKQN